MEERVILVDKNDNEIGSAEKMEAHRNGGKKHRAFSVVIFNDKGETMLQQRAMEKYHCGGMWTNTCCSHPRIGENTKDAAHRRLFEEMGFDTELKEIFAFNYTAKVNNELTENEYDHVFIGQYNQNPNINEDEVMDWRWIDKNSLNTEMIKHPKMYTEWFKIIWEEVKKKKF